MHIIEDDDPQSGYNPSPYQVQGINMPAKHAFNIDTTLVEFENLVIVIICSFIHGGFVSQNMSHYFMSEDTIQ